MHKLVTVLLAASLLGLGACDAADTPPAEESQLHTVKLSSAAEAYETRLKLAAEGAEVSETIKFVDGAWTFTSSLPWEPPYECHYSGGGPLGPGSTACDLRADAESERDVMVKNRWECTDIVKNEATGEWEFNWEKQPNP